MEILNKHDFVGYYKNPTLDKLSADEIKIIDVNGIYDGPLDGVCEWRSLKYCYFYSIDQLQPYVPGERFPNKFILIKLDETQIKIINQEKIIFSRWKLGIISPTEFNKFKLDIKPQVIKKGQILGWFEAIEFEKKTSKFIESYFQWKEQTSY